MKERFALENYLNGLLRGDRIVLAKSITLIESKLESDRQLAAALIDAVSPHTGKSIRIGITGVPGVGKSTFIEAFGIYLINSGRKVAVLTVDPSSSRTKGSILGDKTRMEMLSTNKNAFIRPSPSGEALGGVRNQTRESILLCEAAGYDVILVETVGVGQSETLVSEMVDFFLLLMLAGAGDELQGIKKGIMEMADGILITKADGVNIQKANQAKREYQQALHLFPLPLSGLTPKVETVSSLENEGLDIAWKMIEEYILTVKEKGIFETKRKEQNLAWLRQSINQKLIENFFSDKKRMTAINKLESQVKEGKISVPQALRLLFD